MSKVTPRRILGEEFRDQPWISKLLSPLNTFISQVVQLATNGVTVEDNLFGEIKELEVRTTDLPLKFRCKFDNRPKAIFVGQCEEVSASPAALSGPIAIEWTWTDGVVTVKQVFNLVAGKKYRLNLVVFNG